MPKVLGAMLAKGAFRDVSNRVRKPCPSSPPESQRAYDKTREERGAALPQNGEDVGDAFEGGGKP